METERIDAIKAIIGEIETLRAAVDGHLQEIRDDSDDRDFKDMEQRLEFAFAELRVAHSDQPRGTPLSLSARLPADRCARRTGFWVYNRIDDAGPAAG